MNKLYAVLLVLSSPAFASAQTLTPGKPGNEISSVLDEMSKVTDQIKALDKGDGQWVVDREKNLKATDELLKGAEENAKKKDSELVAAARSWREEFDRHDKEVDSEKQFAAAYNARCGGKTRNASFVAQCDADRARGMAWADKLDNWAADLTKRKASLKQQFADQDAYEKGLQERRDQLSRDTLEWAARKKKYVADRDDLGAKFNDLRDRLRKLADKYESCTASFVKTASPEAVKHRCGNIQFDGASPTLEALRNIKPEWRATANQ